MGCTGALIGFAGSFTRELVAMNDGVQSGDSRGQEDLGEARSDCALCWRPPIRDFRSAHEGSPQAAGTVPLRRLPRATTRRRRGRARRARPLVHAGAGHEQAGRRRGSHLAESSPRARRILRLAWRGAHAGAVGIPGFLRGRRFIAIEAALGYSISTTRGRRRRRQRWTTSGSTTRHPAHCHGPALPRCGAVLCRVAASGRGPRRRHGDLRFRPEGKERMVSRTCFLNFWPSHGRAVGDLVVADRK